MKRKKLTLKQVCFASIVIYFIICSIFYWVGDEQFQYKDVSTTMADKEKAIGEITKKVNIEQSFVADTDIIDSLTLAVATYARQNEGIWEVKIIDDQNNILSENKIDISKFIDNTNYTIDIKDITNVKGKLLVLEISSPASLTGNATTMYFNTQSTDKSRSLEINNVPTNGELCFTVNGKEAIFFGQHYWYFVIIGALFIIIYCINALYKENHGKASFFVSLYNNYIKYKFLIKQLVLRDFKVKYKRSVLGFMWSFLNPLLTMIIQYIVFSTIFRANIDNFPVYLLTGSILFSFFTEAVGAGLTSIVWNASLITKVYVPKYIYPISKVLSTSINLLISMVPLILTAIITGESITKAYLILPFVIICIIVFCIGMSLILSSAMVFFRDTQFLWGIFSLLWMYATPLFYPESIVPDRFSIILKANPMYYYIKFARTIFLDGVSPSPILYMQCLTCGLLIFIIGMLIFKKTQDKFVLFI